MTGIEESRAIVTELDWDIAAILGIGPNEAGPMVSAAHSRSRSDTPARVHVASLTLSGRLKRGDGPQSDRPDGHGLLFLVKSGRLSVGDGATLNAGDIGFIDAAGPFEAQAEHLEMLGLLIEAGAGPRSDPRRSERSFALSSTGPAARLLADWILVLFDNLGDLDADEASSALQAIVSVAGRTLQQGVAPSISDRRDTDVASVARAFIDDNISDHELSPDKVSAGALLSRSRLYQIFDEDGGVEAYIIRRRLDLCLLDIMRLPAATRGVGRIAAKYGFKSDAHFNRVFRKRFSASPGAFIGVGAASYPTVIADAATRRTTGVPTAGSAPTNAGHSAGQS